MTRRQTSASPRCLLVAAMRYPPGRFGALEVDVNGRVSAFREKPKGDGGLINAGFFVFIS